MDIKADKIELARILLDTEDEALIQEVKAVVKSHCDDFWDKLPAHVKEGIQRSRIQAAEGLLTPHEEVMSKYNT